MNKVERKIGRAVQLAKNVRLHRADGGETDPALNQDTSIYDNPYKDQVLSAPEPMTLGQYLAQAMRKPHETNIRDFPQDFQNLAVVQGIKQLPHQMLEAVKYPGMALKGELQRGIDPHTGQVTGVTESGMGPTEAGMVGAGLMTTGALPDVLAGRVTPNVSRVFAGPSSKTADLIALEKAQAMAAQGAEHADIFKQTGWFKGADDKWRYEIPDIKSKVISDTGSIGPLETYMEHPDLYEAYPQIKDITTVAQASPPRGRENVRGSYGPDSNIMTVYGNDPERARSTALHEIQHAIQDIEGFAPGSNNIFLRPGTPAWEVYQERIKAMKTPMTREEFERQGIGSEDFTYKDYLKQTKASLKKNWPMLDRSAQDFAVNEGYKRSAGEVEARNVQSRRDMTPEELQQNPPWQTQDMPYYKQLVSKPREADGGRVGFADGGETDPMLNQDTSIYDNPYKDQVITEYKPTFRDRLAVALSGDNPSFDKQRIVENVTGSRGIGPTKLGLVDAIPVVGNVLGADEALREGDYKGAAMAMMPMPPAIKTEGRVLKAAEKLVAGEHVPVKAPDPYVKGVNDRKPELEKAIKDFYEGNITRGEYDDIVRNILPVTPYEFIPRPAPEDLAVDALNAAKKDKYAMNRNIYREGDPVSLRLDIPAYTNLPNSQWVNSIHDTQGIHPTTYDSVSAARNVDFVVPENKARMTGEGGPKAPYAVMRGEYVPINADEAVAKAREIMEGPLPSQWQQVGMDPRRHSYFYTRDERMMPVTNADEVLQIGPVVYAKNPKIGDRENFGYAEGGRVELADGGSPPWGFDFTQPTIDFQPQQPSVPPLADLNLYKGAPLNKPPEPPQEEQKQEEDTAPAAPHRPEGSGSDGNASTTAPSQPDFAPDMGPPASAAPSSGLVSGLAGIAGYGPGMTTANTVGGLVGGLVGTAVAGPFGGLIGGALGRHAANAISAQDEDEDADKSKSEDKTSNEKAGVENGGLGPATDASPEAAEQSGKSDSNAEAATANMQDGGAITMRRYRANGGPIKVSPSHAKAGPSKISPAQAKAGNYKKKHLNFHGNLKKPVSSSPFIQKALMVASKKS